MARRVAERLVPDAIADWRPHELQGREPAAVVPRLWAELDQTYDYAIRSRDARGGDGTDAEIAELVREMYARSWPVVKTGVWSPSRIP